MRDFGAQLNNDARIIHTQDMTLRGHSVIESFPFIQD